MSNVLEFPQHKIKGYRAKSKTASKKTKTTNSRKTIMDLVYETKHFLERQDGRKIKTSLIKKCLLSGRKIYKRNSIHYKYENLRLVMSSDNDALITAYHQAA